MIALLVIVAIQGGEAGSWTAAPARVTVGDTVWLERVIPAPPGWRVRPLRLDPAADVEPLADPVVERAGAGWQVRYPVVLWTTGAHAIELPPTWLLGPDGRSDSLPGGTARVRVATVLPEPAASTPGPPTPQRPLAPLRVPRRSPWAPVVAALVAAALLAGGWRWRRRAPRETPDAPPPPLDAPVPDARWLAAGEARAVAARARATLRAALGRAVPGAHEGLSTVECVAAVARARPDLTSHGLAATLHALDEAAFASGRGADVAAVAGRARALAAELAP